MSGWGKQTVARKQATKKINELHCKTFGAWVNSCLKKKNIKVTNLIEDLKNGVVLIQLLETLTDQKAPRKWNPNPKTEIQKIDNCALVVDFVRQFLPRLRIDSKDIVNGTTKIILGMLWQLILQFQNVLKQKGDNEGGAGKAMRKAKERLLEWLRKTLSNYDLDLSTDFKKTFSNGMTFCALVHAYDPEIINFNSLDPNLTDKNLELAFSLAEEYMGIPRMIEVEDVPHADDKIIMTYLYEFPRVFLDKMKNKERQKELEEEKRRKQLEEEERKRKQLEEEERKKKLEEEERRRRRFIEEEEERKRKQLEEEERRRRRFIEEEEQRKKQLEEEERKRKKMLEEEEEKKRKEIEEQERLLQEQRRELEKERMRIEEEMRRKMEEEKRRLMEEEQRRAEEYRRKMEEEEKRKKMLEEQERRKKMLEEQERQRLERERQQQVNLNVQYGEDPNKVKAMQEEIDRLKSELEKLRIQKKQGTIGRMAVTVVEARGLVNKNKFDISGKLNPYAIVQVERQKEHTDKVKHSFTPKWNTTFNFYVSEPYATLDVTLFDKSKVFADVFLGKVEIPISSLQDKKEVSAWYELQPLHQGKSVSGEVFLKIFYTRDK